MTDWPGGQSPYGQPGDGSQRGQPLGQNTYGKGYEQEIQHELLQPSNDYTDHIKITPTDYEKTPVRIVTLMVIYRIANESKDLVDYLKSLGPWWNCLNSTWLVATSLPAHQLRDNLMEYIGSSDDLLVIDVTDDQWATAGFTKEATDWLRINTVARWGPSERFRG